MKATNCCLKLLLVHKLLPALTAEPSETRAMHSVDHGVVQHRLQHPQLL